MDSRKAKRSKLSTENEGFWECSVCTYNNRAELFKCEMCDVRKGTSTRKPRLTQVTQQFAKLEHQIEQERQKDRRRREMLTNQRISHKAPSNLNLSNGQTLSITVNGLTVFITDYEVSNHSTEGLSDSVRSSRSTKRTQNGRKSVSKNTHAKKSNVKSAASHQSDDETQSMSEDDEDNDDGKERHSHSRTSSPNGSAHEASSEHDSDESDEEDSSRRSSSESEYSVSNKSSSKNGGARTRASTSSQSKNAPTKKRICSAKETSKTTKGMGKKSSRSSRSSVNGFNEHNSSISSSKMDPPSVNSKKNEKEAN